MPTDDPSRGLWAYFSIDIAGSTLLKIKDAQWYDPILRFLQMTPREMRAGWPGGRAEFNRKFARGKPGLRLASDAPQPERWKLLGDEVVFVQEFTENRPVEFLYSVHAFIRVLLGMRRYLRESFRGTSMPLKGTVWLANKARNLGPNLGMPSGEKEYLGPGVDVGFRIKPYATDKKIALSIEAAYLLALGLKAVGDESALKFMNFGRLRPSRVLIPVIYLEGDILPGIFDGDNPAPYPEILLRILPSSDRSKHRRLVNRRLPVTATDLKEVCEEWMDRHAERVFRPFHPEDPTKSVQTFLDSLRPQANPYRF